MQEILLLTLPLAVFGYAVLSTVALDRQYRRAEYFKRQLEELKATYEIPTSGDGKITMTHIQKTVGHGVPASFRTVREVTR